MGTTTIDLRSKPRHYETYGREKHANVYFRVDVKAYTRALNDHSDEARKAEKEAVAAFDNEIVALLRAEGWTLRKEEYGPGSCPELTKGAQYLYCHPHDISGNVLAADVERLATMIAGMKSCDYRWTDNYGDIVVTTSDEDELQLYHETYDAVIMQKMQEALTTKRRNLYKRAFHATWELYSRQLCIRTTRVQGVLCSDNPGYRYVMEAFGRAVKAGDIIYHEKEDLCRWRSKYDKKVAV